WGKALPHWGEGFPVVPECVPTRGWRTEKSFSRTAMCLTLRALPYWSGTYRRPALPQFCGRDAETDHDSPREYIPFLGRHEPCSSDLWPFKLERLIQGDLGHAFYS